MLSKAKKIANQILPKNKFARAVSILVGGTAVAQMLQLISSPLLTRLYSPEAFGIIAVFLSAIGIFNVVSSLRYETAIPLPEEDEEANRLVQASILGLIATTGGLVLFLLLFGAQVFEALNITHIAQYMFLLPVALMFTGLYQIFSNWSVRKKRYFEVSRVEVARSITLVSVQLLAFPWGALGLIAGHMTSFLVGSWRIVKSYIKDKKDEKNQGAKSLSRLLQVIWKFKQFPMYSMPNGLLNTVGRELPPIVFASAFAPASAGLYYIANLMVQKPINLITGANAKVFISHAPECYRAGKLPSLFFSIYEQSLRVVTLPLTLVGVLAPVLFGKIFGSTWEGGGLVTAMLIPWVLLIALTNPVSPVVGILNKQKGALSFEILLMTLRIGGLAIGVYLGSFMMAVTLFVSGAVLGVLTKLLWLARISKVSVWSVLLALMKELLLATILILSSLVVFMHYSSGDLFFIFISACACIVAARSGKAFVKGVAFG